MNLVLIVYVRQYSGEKVEDVADNIYICVKIG